MMRKLLLLAALGGAWSVHAAPYEIGDLPVCTALTPAAVSLDTTPVDLDVRVLLDGVSAPDGAQVMDRAGELYASLGITLVYSYEQVAFAGIEAAGLIAQAKAYYGGVRPAGIDLVYVLTDKGIVDSAVSGNALAGLADCIGGVKYDDRAFGVGEAWDGEPTDLVIYELYSEKAAKTAAHEIGHLMGGHHHQANCVESLLNIGGSPCTLMFNFIDLQSTAFSLLNGIVVRGHGQAYAVP